VVNNIESVYDHYVKLLEEVVEVIFEEPEEVRGADEKEKEQKKISAFKKISKKIKEGLKQKRRQSHRFYIETKFSADIAKVSNDEILTLVKTQLLSFHNMHDLCLFLLRGEVRMRIYSFLSHIKNQNYWDGEEHTDAEWFIGHLSRELLLVQIAIKPVLSAKKLGFVWENAVDIIVEMLITGLGEIKELSMSKHGLATYMKNVKVLQSELVQVEIVRFR
jgi:hypothetical protein